MTIEAAMMRCRNCDVIIGYTVYVDLVKEYFAGKEFHDYTNEKGSRPLCLAFEERQRKAKLYP